MLAVTIRPYITIGALSLWDPYTTSEIFHDTSHYCTLIYLVNLLSCMTLHRKPSSFYGYWRESVAKLRLVVGCFQLQWSLVESHYQRVQIVTHSAYFSCTEWDKIVCSRQLNHTHKSIGHYTDAVRKYMYTCT